MTGERYVDTWEVNILRFAFRSVGEVEGVDLHVHFFVGLLLLGHLHELRTFVEVATGALFDLGLYKLAKRTVRATTYLDLSFSLGELDDIDSGRLALGVGLEIDLA